MKLNKNKILLIIGILFIFFNIKKIDNFFLNEIIKDTYGKLIFNENWNIKSSKKFNYNWLINNKKIYIEHGYNDKLVNDYSYKNAQKTKFFEADFELSNNQIVLSLENNSDLKIKKFFNFIKNNDKYLIVDFETDFETTFPKFVEFTNQFNINDKIIYQLYTPDNFKLFMKYYKIDYPGPIFTTYKSKRSVKTIVSNLHELNIRVVVIPYKKRFIKKNTYKHNKIYYFVHPIKDCKNLNFLINEFDGFFKKDIAKC